MKYAGHSIDSGTRNRAIPAAHYDLVKPNLKRDRRKSRVNTQDGLRLKNRLRVLFALLITAVAGMSIFGSLMVDLKSSAETAEAVRRGTVSFGDSLIVPTFICFTFLLAYSIRELYRVYRTLNDPSSYHHGQSRRRRRTEIRISGK